MDKRTALVKNFKYTVLFLAILISVWYIAFFLAGNSMRIVSPHRAVVRLGVLVIDGTFWQAVAASLLPISIGWILGCLLGVVFSFLEKDTPVSHFLQWLRKAFAVLPCFPVLLLMSFGLYGNTFAFVLLASCFASMVASWKRTLKGHEALDPDLLLMAQCNAPSWDALVYLRLPHLLPYIGKGMIPAWDKAFGIGILTEFLAGAKGNVGETLREAASSLLTEELFAWVIALCLLGVCLHGVAVFRSRKLHFSPHVPVTDVFSRNGHCFPIVLDRISKHYGEQAVLDKFSYVFSKGKVTAVYGAPRTGKTTLLRISANLLEDDERRFAFPPTAPGLIFKEPCLIPNLTVRENLIFANRACNSEKILKSLALTKEADLYPHDLDLPTQKRVTIARAIAFGGGIGVFDQPFDGMDDDTKALSAAALFGAYRGKTVLFATDNEEDAARYGDEVLKLS